MITPGPLAAALAFTLALPAVLGILLARVPRGGPILGAVAGALVLLSVAWPALPPPSEVLGLVTVAAIAWSIARSARPLATFGAVLLFLAVAEVGARVLVSTPPPSFASDFMPWTARATTRGLDEATRLEREACDLAYAAPPAPETPWVLHLGDSMVRTIERISVRPPGEPLRAAWADRRPDLTHVPRAAVGTSVDVQRMALDRALRAQPAAVLWYVFPFNDAHELGHPWPCCADGPLLDPATLAPRCPTPTHLDPGWATGLLRTATLPWLLRMGAEHSEVAAWTRVAWARTVHAEHFRPPRPWSEVSAVVADGVVAARKAGVPIAVVVLPDTGNLVLADDRDQRPLLIEALRNEGLEEAIAVPAFPTSREGLMPYVGEDGVHFDEIAGFRHLVDGLSEPMERLAPPTPED